MPLCAAALAEKYCVWSVIFPSGSVAATTRFVTSEAITVPVTVRASLERHANTLMAVPFNKGGECEEDMTTRREHTAPSREVGSGEKETDPDQLVWYGRSASMRGYPAFSLRALTDCLPLDCLQRVILLPYSLL